MIISGSTTQRELLIKRLAIINFNVRGEHERSMVGGARDNGVGRLAELLTVRSAAPRRCDSGREPRSSSASRNYNSGSNVREQTVQFCFVYFRLRLMGNSSLGFVQESTALCGHFDKLQSSGGGGSAGWNLLLIEKFFSGMDGAVPSCLFIEGVNEKCF